MKFWMYEKAANSYCFFDRFAASGENGQRLSDSSVALVAGASNHRQ